MRAITDGEFVVNPVIDHDLPIETGLFTLKELQAAIKQTKRGGAIGLDGIPLEIWESEEFLPYLPNTANDTLLRQTMPTQ